MYIDNTVKGQNSCRNVFRKVIELLLIDTPCLHNREKMKVNVRTSKVRETPLFCIHPVIEKGLQNAYRFRGQCAKMC